MANKTALVDQVKNLQRADPDAKQAWWDYCDQHLQGVKDPNRHEPDVLQGFLSTYSAGGCAPVKRAPMPAPAPAMYPMPGQVAAAWGPYAQPAFMPPAAVFGAGGPPPFGSLAESIKMGQRKSSHWKSAWQSYIALYGSGFNDPAKYDENFITGFLDYLGQLGTADLSAAAAEQGINLQEAIAQGGVKGAAPVLGVKRPMGADSGMPPAKRPAIGGMSAEKEALVTKVKALQRSDPSVKEAYQTFCDTHCAGVKDPNRHEPDVLQQFLVSIGEA
jgi:hypothetical protein